MKIFAITCFAVLLLADIVPTSAQTLDSVKADIVAKARENWYWAHGSVFFFGYEVATSSVFDDWLSS